MTPKQRKIRFERLVELGCVVCFREYGRYVAPQMHHLRGHPWSGMGQRAKDQFTIPLCAWHHITGGQGEVGYHQSPAEFERRYGTQLELLEAVEGWL